MAGEHIINNTMYHQILNKSLNFSDFEVLYEDGISQKICIFKTFILIYKIKIYRFNIRCTTWYHCTIVNILWQY